MGFFVKSGRYIFPSCQPPPGLGSRRQDQNLGSQPGRFFGSRSLTVGSWPLIFSGLLVLTGRVCSPAPNSNSHARASQPPDEVAPRLHTTLMQGKGQCSGCIPPHRLGLLTPESGQTAPQRVHQHQHHRHPATVGRRRSVAMPREPERSGRHAWCPPNREPKEIFGGARTAPR